MKRYIIFLVLFFCIATVLLVGGSGGNSSLPDLLGVYVCSDYGFDIGQLGFSPDGTVDLSMDMACTGNYKKSVDKYVLSIESGTNAVSDLVAKERNKAYKITATPNSDGTLTVYIKAKGGYIYYGNESAIFEWTGF